MTSRRALVRRVEELTTALLASEQETRAVREGYRAQLQSVSADRDRAYDEIHLMRGQRDAALAAVAEVQQHTGTVYLRLRKVGELVTGWEKTLPGGFVAEVRALTEPDFAQLLGVPA